MGQVHWIPSAQAPSPQTEILFITSFPPRECGIANYSSDLLNALKGKFGNTYKLSICALESDSQQHQYPSNPRFIFNTDRSKGFQTIVDQINDAKEIQVVVVQHEFGFFGKNQAALMDFWRHLNKPLVFVFHTVIPFPSPEMSENVKRLVGFAARIVVMTQMSADILVRDYKVDPTLITTIPHGTHLVPHLDKVDLKRKYNLLGQRVLTTFGLLSEGKSIETTLFALPRIIADYPDVMFLIIGVTHPEIVKKQGEKYRELLEEKVCELGLENNVRFINGYLPVEEILEYLQLTDIYLFTSKDRNQAVSGTMSYAIGCGCAIVSTPIPHAIELLKDDVGVIVDFEDPHQLSAAVLGLLNDDVRRINLGLNGLHRMASTAWENSAIAHAAIFQELSKLPAQLDFELPPLNLAHIEKLTTSKGMIQFSEINKPNELTGYTLDDNSRALVAMCMHYKHSAQLDDLRLIQVYFDFISQCIKQNGQFLNYIDENGDFTNQNKRENLEDSNGRAIWALGYVISMGALLPENMIEDAIMLINSALRNVKRMHSPRAMAFVIKGLYYKQKMVSATSDMEILRTLSNRLVQMFKHESNKNWHWFESYLTYGNSVLPEAMLCAWRVTKEQSYRDVAKSTFDFLLSVVFQGNELTMISNQGWLHRSDPPIVLKRGGEQPIDVAYLVMALRKFSMEFPENGYLEKIKYAFDWFLGANHLKQIMYNPCTGGCYDGLEFDHVNLNQGAESTVSYLLARLTLMEEDHIVLSAPIRLPLVS
jgi:glycosyltransferase involved in cell wall biosynthesis